MGMRLGSAHGLGAHGWLRLLVVAVLVLVFILTLEATPAAGASRKACRVTNTDSGQTYTRLQQAVDAARRGDPLTVRGICRGTAVIDKDLAMNGVSTHRTGIPFLDGDASGTVLTVLRVEVLIEDLTIEGGRADQRFAPDGRRASGGITDRGGASG